MNILLVCTGNTCRSPMAEGILKAILPGHCVSSAGIMAQEGAGASENAIKTAMEKGIDISGHKARNLTKELVLDADLILCMTQGHKSMIEGVKDKCFTLSEYAGKSGDVSDPFGKDIEEYRACFAQLEELLGIIAEKIEGK